MTLFKNKYRIESSRLKGWDYSSAGLYFVTICTEGRECVFGDLVDGEMQLSPIGEMAQQFWLEIPQHSSANIQLDEFVVMPNHVHGIIGIVDGGHAGRDVACNVSTESPANDTNLPVKNIAMSRISPKSGSLGAIIRSYKSAVGRWAQMNEHSDFHWQERY